MRRRRRGHRSWRHSHEGGGTGHDWRVQGRRAGRDRGVGGRRTGRRRAGRDSGWRRRRRCRRGCRTGGSSRGSGQRDCLSGGGRDRCGSGRRDCCGWAGPGRGAGWQRDHLRRGRRLRLIAPALTNIIPVAPVGRDGGDRLAMGVVPRRRPGLRSQGYQQDQCRTTGGQKHPGAQTRRSSHVNNTLPQSYCSSTRWSVCNDSS
jgi:hypothetical protein